MVTKVSFPRVKQEFYVENDNVFTCLEDAKALLKDDFDKVCTEPTAENRKAFDSALGLFIVEVLDVHRPLISQHLEND